MVKGFALFRIAVTGLAITGCCLAQSATRAAAAIHAHQSPALKGTAAQSLPDAPSAHVSTGTAKLTEISESARLPLTAAPLMANANVSATTHVLANLPDAPSSLAFQALPRKDPDAFFSKLFSPTKLNQAPRYQPASSDKLFGRAAEAAGSIFIQRDPEGKPRLNTAYFLRVLTSVAAENASRRYRARSGTAPLSDFGSTIGNDAGANLLHEFGPGIRQALTSHMPEFVAHFAEHVSRENPRTNFVPRHGR